MYRYEISFGERYYGRTPTPSDIGRKCVVLNKIIWKDFPDDYRDIQTWRGIRTIKSMCENTRNYYLDTDRDTGYVTDRMIIVLEAENAMKYIEDALLRGEPMDEAKLNEYITTGKVI